MTSSAGAVGVFDRAADTYDAVGVPWFGPIAAGLVEALAPRPGERVLDIGCGRGAALLPMARAVAPGGSALGIDLAPRMVERAAQAVADLPGASVRVGDAERPGLPPASFDVVASSLVLFFLDDPAAALVTWGELLVPGGRLGVTTFGEQDPRWASLDERFAAYLPPGMRDARTTGRRGPFASDDAMVELLRGSGLVDVRTADRTVTARFRDPEHFVQFTWSHGQRGMWEHVPEDQRQPLHRELVAAVAGLGDLAFTQRVRYTLGVRAMNGA